MITEIIRNVEIDLKKSDNILGLIANIKQIVFSEQSSLVKEKKPNLAKNTLRKIYKAY